MLRPRRESCAEQSDGPHPSTPSEHAPTAVRGHLRSVGRGEEKGSLNVDGEHRVEAALAGFGGGTQFPIASVVDENIGRSSVTYQPMHGLVGGQVGWDEVGPIVVDLGE